MRRGDRVGSAPTTEPVGVPGDRLACSRRSCSIVVGRHQWFIRDDWAFLFTRERLHQNSGLDDMLFVAQDGHWMTMPIIVYRMHQGVFGTGSYWPYLIPTMACHLGIVVLVRKLSLPRRRDSVDHDDSRRDPVVFGSGWENIVFAIQLIYNLSLLGLPRPAAADRPRRSARPARRAGRRSPASSAVSSSGFGPFFIVGTAVVPGAPPPVDGRRDRHRSRSRGLGMVVAVLGRGPRRRVHRRSPISQVPRTSTAASEAVFQGLTTTASLVGISLLATLAVLLWRRPRSRPRTI